MTFVKLTDPGASATIAVTNVEVIESGKWPDLHFHADDGTIYQVPKNAATRQLDRLKLTPEACIGRIVTISRSTTAGANGKLYWNLDVAGAAPTQTAPAGKPAPKPDGVGQNFKTITTKAEPAPEPVAKPAPVQPGASHDQIFADLAYCISRARSIWGRSEDELPETEIIKLGVTAFIEANRRGLHVPLYDKTPAALTTDDGEGLAF